MVFIARADTTLGVKMGHKAERKIPRTVALTPRQDTLVAKEATRLGLSDGEMLRRIIDWWLELTIPKPTQGELSRKLYGER